MPARILLVDDEPRLRRILHLVLTDQGYEVKGAEGGGEAVDIWQSWNPHLVITDLKMSPLDGLHVLRYGVGKAPDTPCIILTAYGTVADAVHAMKKGAFDFITKPVDHNELIDLVSQALSEAKPRHNNQANLLGASDIFNRVLTQIPILASSDSAVLIQGESGTGKELVAKAIHSSSHNEKPFVKVNCASIPRELLESELFGHKKGSFTGAAENRQGAFIRADGGTLFLDEIGDLSYELQPKILHAVEEKKISPVGSSTQQSVSVKIISATNHNLEAMIEEGQFRLDLFHRLNTMPLVLPPLREREGDIELLAHHFAEHFSQKFERSTRRLAEDTLKYLTTYRWPGNVRELSNVIERAVLVSEDTILSPEALPAAILNNIDNEKAAPSTPLDLVAKEQELLQQALIQCHWNQSKAAKLLNISRSALRYRLQKYNIKR